MRFVVCLLLLPMLITPVFASDWSMFKKDLSHSGFTADTVNPPLVLKWTFNLDSNTDSSPVIVNDVLYIGSDGGVHAIDAKTGRRLWSTNIGFVRAVPTVVDGVLYVGGDNRFYAIDTKDGTIKWSYKNATDRFVSSAAVANNLAYVGSKDGYLYAFDIQTGEPSWLALTGKEIESSAAIADGIIFFGTNGGVIIALDAANGDKKWRYDTGVTDIKSSPLVANGTVFVGSNNGNIYALTTKGTLKWTYATGNNVESSPSVKGSTIFAGSKDSNLYAIDAQTGVLKWKFNAGGYVDSSPAISNNVVYFGSKSNVIYALDADTGKLLWRNSTGTKNDDYITSPAVSGNMLYAVNHSGFVLAYSGIQAATATATPTTSPTIKETTATPTPSPGATQAERKTPGFEFPLLILLITVLIRKRLRPHGANP